MSRLGDTSRVLNWLMGGKLMQTTSASVGRKAMLGRRWFIIAEALINLPFAVLGKRDHCFRQYVKELAG